MRGKQHRLWLQKLAHRQPVQRHRRHRGLSPAVLCSSSIYPQQDSIATAVTTLHSWVASEPYLLSLITDADSQLASSLSDVIEALQVRLTTPRLCRHVSYTPQTSLPQFNLEAASAAVTGDTRSSPMYRAVANSSVEAQALAALIAEFHWSKVVVLGCYELESLSLLSAFTAALSPNVTVESTILLTPAEVFDESVIKRRLLDVAVARDESYVFVLLMRQDAATVVLNAAGAEGLGVSQHYFWLGGAGAMNAALLLTDNTRFSGMLGVRPSLAAFIDAPMFDIRQLAVDFSKYWRGLVTSQWTHVTVNTTASDTDLDSGETYIDSLLTGYYDGICSGAVVNVEPLDLSSLVTSFSRRQDVCY